MRAVIVGDLLQLLLWGESCYSGRSAPVSPGGESCYSGRSAPVAPGGESCYSGGILWSKLGEP